MAGVEVVADAMGVPVWALIPIAMVAAAALLFVLDGLSFVVLKPHKSPPVISTLPLLGGMMQFLKGPIGLMANAMPKYGEVFTGECFPSHLPYFLPSFLPPRSRVVEKMKDTRQIVRARGECWRAIDLLQ